jgi:hypothetical protein
VKRIEVSGNLVYQKTFPKSQKKWKMENVSQQSFQLGCNEEKPNEQYRKKQFKCLPSQQLNPSLEGNKSMESEPQKKPMLNSTAILLA